MLLKAGTYLLSFAVWIALNLAATAQINEQADTLHIKTDSIIGTDSITGTDSISFLTDTTQMPEDTSEINSDSAIAKKKEIIGNKHENCLFCKGFNGIFCRK